MLGFEKIQRTSFVRPRTRKRISEVLLFAIGAVLAGVTGLITVGVLFWLSDIQREIDDGSERGDPTGLPSRLGGVAIFISALCVLVTQEFSSSVLLGDISQHFSVLETAALLVGLVGLMEDVFGPIKIVTRLVCLFLISGIAIALRPDLVPINLVTWLDLQWMNKFWIMAPLTLVFIVAFVNAGNIADGVNGLVVLVLGPFFFVIYDISSDPFGLAILLSLSVFTAFNLFTGRIFLGDLGSYLLSALACLWALEIYGKEPSISIWLFASLLTYPCVNFVIAIFRRVYTRIIPTHADQKHLHNRLNRWLNEYYFSALLANSISGVLIAVFTSGPAFILYVLGVPTNSPQWFSIFIVEALVLLVASLIFALREVRNGS